MILVENFYHVFADSLRVFEWNLTVSCQYNIIFRIWCLVCFISIAVYQIYWCVFRKLIFFLHWFMLLLILILLFLHVKLFWHLNFIWLLVVKLICLLDALFIFSQRERLHDRTYIRSLRLIISENSSQKWVQMSFIILKLTLKTVLDDVTLSIMRQAEELSFWHSHILKDFS